MSLRVVICTALASCTISASAAAAPESKTTYAERLGWPSGTKVVIFHVDDAGMSYDSDQGVIQALAGGVATSTSVMMPCPWVPHMVAYLKDHPQLDAGLHLTLNSEWNTYRWGPLVGKPAAPGLVDSQGYLWSEVKDVLDHATVEEFEKEIRAQIDKAQAIGIVPTHLDSHMGTCFYEPFIESYVKVGIEKKIPILMIGGHMQHAGPELGKFKLLLTALGERVWKGGLPVIDDLVTQPTNAPEYEGRKRQLLKLLTDIQPGITQIIVHCTAPTEVFSQISGSGKARAAELRLMLDPDIRSLIKEQGIVLTTWRELKQRRDASRS